MSLANVRASQEYQEAVEATEDFESPAVGFAKPVDYKSGVAAGQGAVIRQNNTILFLLIKQTQKIAEIEEKLDKLKQQVESIGKREADPVNLEGSISDLTKRLNNFSVTNKVPSKRSQGPIYVFEDPNKIFKEQFGKEPKQK